MMRSFTSPASLLLSLTLIFSYVAAQGLSECAQSCVGITKTKCKPTDYACACSDKKYIPRLTKCIENFCEDKAGREAHAFLQDLCRSAGAPLADDPFERIEVRQVSLDARQDISFTNGPTGTRTTRSPTGPTGNPAQGTAAGSNGGDGGSGGGSSGGLSTGAKVGIGIGVPVGVIIIGGLVGLAFWLGRKSKRQNATAATGGPGQPQMQGPTGPMGPTGPAELSQGAQYIGHEMPTKGNTAEMPAPISQAYTPGQPQPQYKPQQQYPPQQWGSPPPGQQWATPPPGHQWAPTLGQPQYGQPGQPQYGQPGQPQYGQPGSGQFPQQLPAPQQQQVAAELPETRQNQA